MFSMLMVDRLFSTTLFDVKHKKTFYYQLRESIFCSRLFKIMLMNLLGLTGKGCKEYHDFS